MIDSRMNPLARVLVACSAALLGLVMTFVLLKGGSLAAPLESHHRSAAMVTFDIQGLDSPVVSVVPFTVTVRPQATITDTETMVRYYITATKEGDPLSGQDIYYPEAGDPLDEPTQWHTFTTNLDGGAAFGPAGGFNLGAIGDGITTTFWTRLGSGDYALTLQLREVPTGTVRGETIHHFATRPAARFTSGGLVGDLTSGTVPFSVTAQVTETTGISTTPPITTWLRYQAQVLLDTSPLADQVIYYPAAGDDVQDPSTWHSFTTNAEGVAWFGPASGFRLSDLPELTEGITTPFQTDLGSGIYTLTIALMDISEGPDAARNLGEGEIPFEVQLPRVDLTLEKTVEPTAGVDLGDVVTYSLTLTNLNELHKAVNVSLSDTLPVSVTFGGFVGDPMNINASGTVTWSGELGAGDVVSAVFTATVVDDPALYGATITNTATFAADNAEPGTNGAGFAMLQPIVLELEKTVEPETDVGLGDVVTYTLALMNTSSRLAEGVELSDTLPVSVTFGGFVGDPMNVNASGTVTWSGELRAGEIVSAVFTATLGSDRSLYGTTVSNNALFTSTNANSGMESASFTVEDRFLIYLPLILRNYKPLSNGDFETGDLSGWQALSGGFRGHGSGLPQNVVLKAVGYVAMLGDPDFSNGDIPVGYGAIAQTFAVEGRYLRFRYRIDSEDVYYSSQTDKYWDTFEVSLNQRPQDVTMAQRDAVCANLNPDGETIVAPTEGGLLVCGGRRTVDDPTNPGWREVVLDLTNFTDATITLYFHVWNRQYSSPAYNDRGWWNTSAMVDSVEWIE